ncbi:hypothetical protein ATKI12_0253 [Kitasatospora sp. Ki12]
MASSPRRGANRPRGPRQKRRDHRGAGELGGADGRVGQQRDDADRDGRLSGKVVNGEADVVAAQLRAGRSVFQVDGL